ncbi:hypothetical protein BC831DRAFT_485069 [Entophlyctis helioformis]|nr:hypothetical protein BC831DRAFT_485069 [Entophlyctis helioformis]
MQRLPSWKGFKAKLTTNAAPANVLAADAIERLPAWYRSIQGARARSAKGSSKEGQEHELGRSRSSNHATIARFPADDDLNARIAIHQGDITCLALDAIVNAANKNLLGGGGVDGAIHKAAGPDLVSECRTLRGCETGDAKITKGYNLPSKHVIHTVGPIIKGKLAPNDLASCYHTSLNVARQNGVRSIAFPCISTGIYGYPNVPAAHVALKTIREWLEADDNRQHMDLIVFCVFLPVDKSTYTALVQEYFPPVIM